MARRPGAGLRWLAAAILPATFCAAAPPAAPIPAVAPPRVAAPVEKGKSVKMQTTPPRDAADAAVLDYLGRYGDAAIGLDPMGLDPMGLAPDDDADAAPRKERDEH